MSFEALESKGLPQGVAMISTPKCYERKCKHFQGIEDTGKGDSKIEDSGLILVCAAFPEGIPKAIAYGDDPHYTPLDTQGNDIEYEKEEK